MALFEVNEKSSIPIWLQLKNRFIYLITSGYYKPGDQLPTVRGLAAEVEVNYNTVSKVYHEPGAGRLHPVEAPAGRVRAGRERTSRGVQRYPPRPEIVTQEYLKRCFELGMSLEDIEEQFAQSMSDEKSKRDAAVGARA